jgi:hypothetical protein
MCVSEIAQDERRRKLFAAINALSAAYPDYQFGDPMDAEQRSALAEIRALAEACADDEGGEAEPGGGDDEHELAGDDVPANGKRPCTGSHAIRGPPRRGPSLTKISRAAIAIARCEGCPGVRIEMPDGTIIHYDLRPEALDPGAEVNPFDAPLLPAKRGRS